MSDHSSGPSPVLLFQTFNAYQRTAALQAAIELDLFSAVGEGATAAQLAERCGAAERGARILADFLVIIGFLIKHDDRYQLTPDSAVFLVRSSPAYMGGAAEFILSPTVMGAFQDLAGAVRKGGSTLPGDGTVDPEHPVWVRFARAMMPMMAMPARGLAQLAACDPERELKVLDIAAGHGLFGIAFARQYPRAQVTAVDWAPVLEVARHNAAAAGVGERYHTLPGSAFEVELGTGYDVVLLTNFLHHFDVPTCEGLLRRIHAALGEGGRAITLEFVPNPDRVTPPDAAVFSLTMLASTPHGDAYTLAELESMFRNAGFARSEAQPVPASVELAVTSYR